MIKISPKNLQNALDILESSTTTKTPINSKMAKATSKIFKCPCNYPPKKQNLETYKMIKNHPQEPLK